MQSNRLTHLPQRCVALFLILSMLAGCSSMALVSTDTLMEQGIALYNEGRYDESVLRFEGVLEREPKRYLAYVYIARSLMGKFEWGDALNSARKAFELAPGNGEVIATLGEGLLGSGLSALQEGNFTSAIEQLSEHLKLTPGSADGYLGLAQAYLRSGSLGKALAAAQQAMQLDPDDNAVRSLLNELGAP